MNKKTIITVRDTQVTVLSHNQNDYISLTDMAKGFDGGGALIEQWLRNKDTIEFLGIWELINDNNSFNSLEFERIKTESGTNRFYLSVKKVPCARRKQQGQWPVNISADTQALLQAIADNWRTGAPGYD